MFFAPQSSKSSRKPSQDDVPSDNDEGQSPMSQDSSDKNIVAQSLKCLDDEEEEEDEGYDLYGGFSKKAQNALNGKHVSPPSVMNGGNSNSNYQSLHNKPNGLHQKNGGGQIDSKRVMEKFANYHNTTKTKMSQNEDKDI